MYAQRRTFLVAAGLLVSLPSNLFGINFAPLDFPGATFTEVSGIDGNNIVGYYQDATGAQHGFLYDGSSWTTLDVPFPTYYGTRAHGISGNKIVGSYLPGPRGFAFDGTTWTQLDYPGSASGNNQAIDGDNIVGLADAGGFHYDGTTWTPLTYPGSVFTNPLGIDGNKVVGFYQLGDFFAPRHGFVYDGTDWDTLDYPGSVATEARGIDGSNIVGNWSDSLQGHGFIYDGTSWQSFDYPGSIGTVANDMSGGRIVGLYFDATGNAHSFLATIPEPANFILAAFALLLAGAWRTPRNRHIQPGAWFVVLAAVILIAASQRPACAINIIMEYTDAGDTPPHPENPTWDPDGSILIEHFQAAEAIWEALLPGGGDYTFDFHWDDNLDPTGLALTSENGGDVFIEVNPNQLWFADFTPGDHAEFAAPTQRLYSGLSAPDQSLYFPGTVPPGALEVNFQSLGITHNSPLPDGTLANTASRSTQMTTDMSGNPVPVDASNGFDLLGTIVHEIGHVLGIFGTEPGEYNIDPQHVGGLTNVLVLEGGGGHLGGGPVPPPVSNIVPGFLMCNSCGVRGLRPFATATDVLVIAEDQGITVVQLDRVGRISSGNWSDTTAWIGGDVPDATQDAYISHGGMVTLDVDAGAKNLLVSSGNALAVGGRIYYTPGTITFAGGNLTVGPGGAIIANTLVGNPSSIFSAAGSLVRFNQFTEIAATSASFNGSLAIGFDNIFGPFYPTQTMTFNPTLANWSIGENLIIADEVNANLIVDNGTWTVNGNVTLGKVLTGLNGGLTGGIALQNDGGMTITGNLDIPLGFVTVEDTATLNVTGNITIGKESGIIFRDNRSAPSKPYSLPGGFTTFIEGTPIFIAGGYLTFEDTASAADASVTLEGGSGYDASGAVAAFKGDSSATTAEFRTKGGRFGPGFGGSIEGKGGQVLFEDDSGASTAIFFNEGSTGPAAPSVTAGGTGGRTLFAEDSSAEQSTIHNHGATYNSGLGAEPGGGTHFLGNSTAGTANIFNHADGNSFSASSEARTVFFDSSNAGNATIENEAASGQSVPRGRTEFRNNSSAADATINNRGYLTVGWLAGRTLFYDAATAANADINLFGGYSDDGLLEFRQSSTAGNATIVAHNIPTIVGRPNNGGRVFFYDNSSAGQSQITLRQNGQLSSIQFHNNATAASAQIVAEDLGGSIQFRNNSTAANANISLGRQDNMFLSEQSTAGNATITLAHGAQVQFNMSSSAGQANIVAAGSTLYPLAGGAITFNSTSTVNNSTITLHGSTAQFATGASAAFINGAHAGNATITANGGSGGGGGATITFSNSYGDTAQTIANAGSTVDFVIQPTFNNGTTTLGSIEGAGSYILRGSHLIAGSLNLSTTVSGPIKDNPTSNPFYSGGRLTKVGTGTLTLAGANNYSGLTTVNEGTLSVTGSIPGSAVVNNGGTLSGTGSIAGLTTVNSGAHLAPGASIGTITMDGGLTTNAGSFLDFELGVPSTADKINVTLAGGLTLNGGTVNLINAGGLGAGTYTLIDYAGMLGGALGNLALGTQPAGFSYSLVNNTGSTSIDLTVSPAGVPGDYNNNGSVDAADYVLWRNGGPLANEVDNPGTVNAQDYTEWRSRFGNSSTGAGSGATGSASASSAVPEPSAILLLGVGAFGATLMRRPITKLLG